MKNELEYRIENGALIIDSYFNNFKIGSINGGSVENILNKCKLYDEEYETLLKENEYMIHIAKDFEQLQQENKQLKEILKNVEYHTFCDGVHDCEVYIGHNCRYSYDDFPCDFCIFCGKPSERK